MTHFALKCVHSFSAILVIPVNKVNKKQFRGTLTLPTIFSETPVGALNV